MTSRRRFALAWPIALALTGGLSASRAPATASKPCAFLHVNVIPMDRERILADQTVIVRHGRIVEVGPTQAAKIPSGACHIQAKGST